MSIYKNYDIVPGDKILLNDEYQVGDSSDRLPKGTAFWFLILGRVMDIYSVSRWKSLNP